MSGYTELRALGVTFRPFDDTPPRAAGRTSPFSASWTSTVELLADELRHLGAKTIVVELALREQDVRLDGMPRADARLSSPAVRISFESKWGPLRYETAEFDSASWCGGPGWQQNLRAIALGMQALRAVDRYGVSKRGEQYRGWRQLPQTVGDPTDRIVTREDALDVLDHVLEQVTGDPAADVKKALRNTHPDAGGDATEFRKVMKAKEILNV